MLAGGLAKKLDLQCIVHHEIEVVLHSLSERILADDAFQNQDRPRDAGGAQCNAILDARHGERVGLGKRARGVRKTVTVGVGFYDRGDARMRRTLAQCLQVCAQCLRVNDGPDEPAHFNTPSA
jgi:hypothetical protein